MGLDNRQDDFLKSNDTFWNDKEDDFWNSDERYIRKDEYTQNQNASLGTDTNRNQASMNQEYMNQAYRNQSAYAGNISGYSDVSSMQPDKMDEYRRNTSIFLRVVISCVAVIAVAVIFTVVYLQATRNMMERKIRELDYVTETHDVNERISVNNCHVIVSDAYIFADSSEVWMPQDKLLIGVQVKASSDVYTYDGGIKKPYLQYKENQYVFPVTDQKLQGLLVNMGMDKDDFLPTYSIGTYGTDIGYYFFLVDEDTEEPVFMFEEYEKSVGRIEYLKARHKFPLKLAGYY